jgi:hypothetical protein
VQLDCFSAVQRWLAQPLGAAACFYAKERSSCRFDHVGVVVLHLGIPYVVEATFSGVRVRAFAARISRATLALGVARVRCRCEDTMTAFCAPRRVKWWCCQDVCR